MPPVDEDKRKWVVREIESWRRAKMLPEHYCDFLQNLYLDDLTVRPKSAAGERLQKIGQASGKQWLYVLVIFSLICLVALHFSAFPPALQIAISVIGTGVLVALGSRFRDSLPARGLTLLSAGMLLLPASGAAILHIQGWTEGPGLFILLVASALIWIVCGIAERFAVLHWLGWMGIVALYAAVLSRQAPHPSWLEVQVFWVPAALLFAWLSWFLHVKFKMTGAVLFATALILWFMPEVYSALFGVARDWIQIELLIKIALVGTLMFRLRRQWMEWVA
ncbi:hypothetical protein [Cohnella sp. 56]|uniref:hypothetical protein n=1 Tax=Cohnella sp. 56 TaxID=3113722 RepID=UPI0030E7DE47